MLNSRSRGLPEGWYPSSAEGIRRFIRGIPDEKARNGALAAMVPHAGWEFCGAIIARAMKCMAENLNSIVILGGHNPPGGLLVRYDEDAWDFPTTRLYRDAELSDSVNSKVSDKYRLAGESSADNTVEVVLSMAAALLPEFQWAAWRLPSDERSLFFGAVLAEAVKKSGKRVAVIGSTDLTHYGPNYDFMPGESQDDPRAWVKKRDYGILRSLADFDGIGALEAANKKMSACSAGGAVGAMEYARVLGARSGTILDYSTSSDLYPSSSFVAYGSIIWEIA